MIRLGPFDVEDVIARGGMGEIWRGRHRAQGTPVAVKVMTGLDALSPRFLAHFRSEVRAASGLDHPNVVLLFDHGTIPASASRASGGRLVADSPYLVMEFASGGSLAQQRAASSWSQFRALMDSLLAAVAHAHARGVIHRDIKPGNVLRCTRKDMRVGLKLADFGIARMSEFQLDGDPTTVSGTLRYMAPEQASGHWREEGPWTDLYSLGCVAFRLASGNSVPEPRLESGYTHWLPIPSVHTRFATPAGFESWLARMTAPDPDARFAHAADAAWALSQLGDVSGSEPFDFFGDDTEHEPDVDEQPTRLESFSRRGNFAESSVSEEVASMTSTQAVAPLVFDPEPTRVSTRVTGAVPMPTTWHEMGHGVASPRLLGAGIGLYGLRAVPVVGREAERDGLWAALRAVRDDGLARMVVLEGASGCGKSRLAEWLCERAAETGASSPLRATHESPSGPGDGLAPMLARALRTVDLADRALIDRVRTVLAANDSFGDDEVLALAQFVTGSAQIVAGDQRVLRLESAIERFEVLRRHIVRTSRDRPTILWIDDAQWAADALAFAQFVLERRHRTSTALLIVATVRADALAGRELESQRLAALYTITDAVTRMEIGPLPPDQWPVLVRELLGLEGELAQRVEQRTAGNPLFAVQLVGDWVHRGLLVPGPSGFRLRSDAIVMLPDTIHEVWTERTMQLLADRDPRDGDALELAAVLGTDVRADEWREVCAIAGLKIPAGLVDDLLDRRLAYASPAGPRGSWSFVHGMFRESLERRAAENLRLAQHHAVCARHLAQRTGRGIAERFGRHALASGDAIAALAPLLFGAREHLDFDDAPTAIKLLHQREDALQELRLPDDDLRWGENWAELALAEVRRGQMSDALRWAQRAEEAARRYHWPPILATALYARGRVERWRGMNAEAERVCSEALSISEALGDLDGAARCEWWMAAIASSRGAAAEGLEHAARAVALSEKLGDKIGVARALVEAAVAEHRLGHLDQARALLARARANYASAGSRHGVAATAHQLAEVLREENLLEEAEPLYRQALEIFTALGSSNWLIVRLNIGLLLLARRAFAEARVFIEDTQRGLEQSGLLSMLACSHIEVLAPCADVDDWGAWDAHYIAGMALLGGSDLLDPDLAWAARLAADLARDRGQIARARDLYELSITHWRGLGRAREVDETEAALEALSH